MRYPRPTRVTPLDATETAAYWCLRQYGAMHRSETRSVREMNVKRSSSSMAVGPVPSYLWADRQMTAEEALRHARAMHLENKRHEQEALKKAAKDAAFTAQVTRMKGRDRADESPIALLIGRQCRPCDPCERIGSTWAYSHLEQLNCRIVAVKGEKEDRRYTVEVIEHPAISKAGSHWRKNSLRGMTYTLSAVSLTEEIQDRRTNETGRKAVDTANKYRIAWSVIGGAVVIPGTKRTYDYRLRLRGVGCSWDKNRKAWIA